MSVIYFLTGLGILVAGGFLVFFIWAVKSGQFEDVYTPSVRILFDNNNSDTQDENDTSLEHENNEKKSLDKSGNSNNHKN